MRSDTRSTATTPIAVGFDSRTPTVILAVCVGATLVGATVALFDGVVAVAVFCTLVLGATTLLEYRVGLALCLLLVPLAVTSLMPHELLGLRGLNPLNVMVVLTLLSFVVARALASDRMRWPPRFFVVYALTIMVAGINGLQYVDWVPLTLRLTGKVSFDGPAAYLRDKLAYPLIVLALVLLTAQVAGTRRGATLVVASAAIGTIGVAMATFVNVALSGYSMSLLASGVREPLSAFNVHANELGLMFNLALAVLIYTWHEAVDLHRAARMTLAVAIGLLFVAVLMTFSRGAYIAMAVTVLWFALKYRRSTLIVVLPVAVVAAIIPTIGFVERLTTGVQEGDLGAITAGRLDAIWLPLLPELLDAPLIGKGLSSTLWASAQTTGQMLPVGHPHSAYLATLLDFGLLGSAVVFAFFVLLWRRLDAARRQCKDAFVRGVLLGGRAALVVLAVQGITDDELLPAYNQLMLWLAVGVLLAQPQSATKPSTPRTRITQYAGG